MARSKKRKRNKPPAVDMQLGALGYFSDLKRYTDMLAKGSKTVSDKMEKVLAPTGGFPAGTEPGAEETKEDAVATTKQLLAKLTNEQRVQVQSIRKTLAAEKAKYANAVDLREAHKTATRSYNRTDKANETQVNKQLKAVGIPRPKSPKRAPQRKGYLKENDALILSLGPEHWDRVEEELLEGFSKGRSSKSMAKNLAKIDGITERRAGTIARDQTATLNGLLTKDRHTENGITKFLWITVDDERVRTSHEELNGLEFTWKTGAKGDSNSVPDTAGGTGLGFPGTPILCRCYAEPVF